MCGIRSSIIAGVFIRQNLMLIAPDFFTQGMYCIQIAHLCVFSVQLLDPDNDCIVSETVLRVPKTCYVATSDQPQSESQ